MSAGAPWSVKGIDPKAREIAKDLARRSGMTLGEWLNQVILEDGDDDGVVTLGRRGPGWDGGDRRNRNRRLDDAYGPAPSPPPSPPHVDARDDDEFDRVVRALDALSARIEAAENRSTLAVSGVNQAVSGLLARLENAERDQSAVSARVEHVTEDLRDEQGRIIDRIRQVEREAENPRSLDALRALETALGKIANQVYEGDARTRASFEELRRDVTAAVRRVDRLETAGAGPGETQATVDSVVGRIAERMELAEARTNAATRALEVSFGQLDDRLRAAEQRLDGERENRFERLASELSARVEESRAELLSRFDTVGQSRSDQVERALGEFGEHIRGAEKRSAEAIERMGREVLRIAQNLNGRMNGVERSSAEAVDRVAQAVEARLKRGDDAQAQALEKLGGEIARISEKLGERIAQSERRSTLAADDMGERLGRLSDKLEARWDRASSDFAERIRESEERTARLLEEARETIDRSLARVDERALAAAAPAPASAPAAPALDAAPADWDDVAPFPEPTVEAFADEDVPAFPAFPALPGFPQTQASAEPVFEDVFAGAAPLESFGARATGRSESFDEFSADTEFLESVAAPTRPPVSTREAIEAARAATRLGVRDRKAAADGGGLFGGKKDRLHERVGRQARRDGSTIKKALLSSAVAVVVASTAMGGYQILTEDQRPVGAGADGLAAPVEGAVSLDAPVAAVALAPKPLDPAESADRAEGARLYDEAVAKLGEGGAGAVDALRKAADLGHPAAQFHLAKLYETGDSGVRKDLSEARRWTERAALAGERRAMHNLGLYAFDGVGGAKDLAVAARWFQSAAALGLVDSQYNLGRLYEQGLGVAQDRAQAYEWYLIAANAGDEESRAAADALGPRLGASQRAAAERAAAAFQSDRSESEPAALASR